MLNIEILYNDGVHFIKNEDVGKCPAIKPGQIGICIHECSSNSQCKSGEVCCGNGCGRVCQKGVKGRMIISVFQKKK